MLSPYYTFLLDVQRALLGAITPSLRAVSVDMDLANKKLLLFFFFDGKISEKLFDLASVAATEAGVSLPEYFTDDQLIQLDLPQEIPFSKKLVFLRKESHMPAIQKENFSSLFQQTSPSVILLLELQQALLGKVTPELRLVAGGVNTDQKELDFYFIYDGKISDENFDLASAAIREASQAFPGYKTNAHIDRIDSPHPRSAHGNRAAYLRKE